MLHKFGFGGANLAGTYYDEPNRRMLMNIRAGYAKEGEALAMENKKDSALKILNLCDSMILGQNFPYGYTAPGNMHNVSSLQTVYAYYVAGDSAKAKSISDEITRDCEQQLAYYSALPADKLTGDLQDDQQRAQMIIQQLQSWQQLFIHSSKVPELPQSFDSTMPVGKDSSNLKAR